MCRVSGGWSPNLDELLWSHLAPGGFLAAPPWLATVQNLPFGTQGRSWRLESCLQEMGDKKASVPRSPTGPCSAPAETRRVWFYSGTFIFWSWRLRISAVFLLGNSSRVQESWFARLTKSGVDTVFHSILVLFIWKERSQFSPWINIELKTTWVESTSEGKPEFSLKNNLKPIVIVMNRLIRFLCARLNCVPNSRLWESPENCLIKLPKNFLNLIM